MTIMHTKRSRQKPLSRLPRLWSSIDHDAIRDAMSGMHYVGVTGDMTLDETGTPEKSVAILTFTPSDGKLVQKFVKTQS